MENKFSYKALKKSNFYGFLFRFSLSVLYFYTC